MPEEVLYADVRFIKANRESSAAPTFSKGKLSRTRPPTAELPEGPQPAALSRRSKVTSERVALLVLSALLAAAVIALCVTNQPRDKCEAGWEHHGGKCYYFSSSESSWEESSSECGAKGGDLVKIESMEEQKFLEEKMRLVNKTEEKFWIGLKQSAEDGWFWMDGSPLDKSLTFWSRNQPDTRKGTTRENPPAQSCVRVGVKGVLKLTSCRKAQSVCEKPAV